MSKNDYAELKKLISDLERDFIIQKDEHKAEIQKLQERVTRLEDCCVRISGERKSIY